MVASQAAWSGARGVALGTGWEPALLLLLTAMLLGIGIVSVYSASAVMAQSHGLPDYHFVVRQATGAAVGFVLLVVMAFVDYRRLRILAWPILIVLLLTLLAMIIPGMYEVARSATAPAAGCGSARSRCSRPSSRNSCSSSGRPRWR
jgi:hypothetical protein